jgi:hypothetical protein
LNTHSSDAQRPSTSANDQPGGRWTECSFEVDGRRVGVSVKRLDHDERQRMAAEIAWFVEGLLTPGVELGGTGWPALLGEILSRCVVITLDEEGLEDTDDFWNRVISRTFEAFAVTNQLYPRRLFEGALTGQ